MKRTIRKKWSRLNIEHCMTKSLEQSMIYWTLYALCWFNLKILWPKRWIGYVMIYCQKMGQGAWSAISYNVFENIYSIQIFISFTRIRLHQKFSILVPIKILLWCQILTSIWRIDYQTIYGRVLVPCQDWLYKCTRQTCHGTLYMTEILLTIFGVRVLNSNCQLCIWTWSLYTRNLLNCGPRRIIALSWSD